MNGCTIPGMQYAGELYSLGAATVWAVAVILLRRSGETTTPFSLNLFLLVTFG